MQSLAPETALKFTTLGEMVAASIDTARFRALLFAGFAALALLLAMAGVYGVVAFLATQRSAEFGVRIALGASRRQVFAQVVGQAATLAAQGLALGAGLSLAAGRLLDGMLFGLRPGDVPTYLIVAVVLGAVVLAAAAFPAWRASRVDPVSVLQRA
jgi:ABC-type antimicrobial peptide transport system permease subunit